MIHTAEYPHSLLWLLYLYTSTYLQEQQNCVIFVIVHAVKSSIIKKENYFRNIQKFVDVLKFALLFFSRTYSIFKTFLLQRINYPPVICHINFFTCDITRDVF